MGNAGDNWHGSMSYEGQAMPQQGAHSESGWIMVAVGRGAGVHPHLTPWRSPGRWESWQTCLRFWQAVKWLLAVFCIVGSPRRPPWRLGSCARTSAAAKSVWEEHNEAQLSANVTTWCYSLLFPFLFFLTATNPRNISCVPHCPVWKP